jgi:hypothetical protein
MVGRELGVVAARQSLKLKCQVSERALRFLMGRQSFSHRIDRTHKKEHIHTTQLARATRGRATTPPAWRRARPAPHLDSDTIRGSHYRIYTVICMHGHIAHDIATHTTRHPAALRRCAELALRQDGRVT